MGYELNRLMKQYGVNTASVAGYAGTQDPGTAPAAPAALGDNATNAQTKKYNEDLAKYNTDKAAFDEQKRRYDLDKASYDAYRTNYFDRLQNAPMYLQEQFQTSEPKPLYINPTLPGGNAATYSALRDQGFSDPAVRAQADRQFGVQTDKDWSTLVAGYKPGAATPVAGVNYNLGVATPNTVQDLYRTYLGREPEAAGLANWQNKFGAEISPMERAEFYRAAMPEMQTRGMNTMGTNAYRATGSYYGDQLAGPTYVAPTPGTANTTATSSPTSSTNFYRLKDGVSSGGEFLASDYDTYTPEGVVDMSRYNYDPRLGGFLEKPVVYDAARGGSVRDLVKKYQVGGAVRRFQAGGSNRTPRGYASPEDEAAFDAIFKSDGSTQIFAVPPQPSFGSRDSSSMSVLPPMRDVAEPPPAEQPTATRSMAAPQPAPVTASPAARPIEPKPATNTPVSPAATDLMAMLQRYASTDSTYGPELTAARGRLTTESDAFQKMIADAIKPQGTAPDKTEMYFRLAAAFGAPTRTGHFAENLGLVGKELGEYSKDVRAAKKAEQQLRLQLGLEAQKLKLQGAREDLTTLRTLAGEEMKDKRAVVMEYIKSGRPQSEAGKAAIDAGLKQGTPEFTAFVNKYIDDKIRSGNLLKEARVAIAAGNLAVSQSRERRAEASSGKLTPGEVKLKAEAEEALGGIDDAMGSLKRAYSLNPNTFDGTLASIAQRKILEQTDPKDPRVLATREQQNLLSKGAISNLRTAFGGNPTEGERKALLDLEGIDAKSKEERAQIMKNTYKLLQQRRAREQKRLNDITQGLYRETTPSAGDLD